MMLTVAERLHSYSANQSSVDDRQLDQQLVLSQMINEIELFVIGA